MSRRWLLLLVSGVMAGLLVMAAAGWLETRWEQTLRLPLQGAVIEVTPGDGLGVILQRAETAGWLEDARWVGFLAARKGLDQRMHVGEYALTPGLTAASLVSMLAEGALLARRVTLPEGITLARALEILCGIEALACTLDGPRDPRLLALVAPYESAEGWFLPETYQFHRGDSDLDVLKQAHTLMRERLDAAWANRAADLPLSTPFEALILASIIERETGQPDERGAIAGVFTRRLTLGMRLQTDPTVIYGLGQGFSGNLTRAHLRDDKNPYNTYRISGLPPTPIALPGEAALRAATRPLAGEALYFVAKGDGSHAFAVTLTEHEANVRQYQLRRRSDYRSSPK